VFSGFFSRQSTFVFGLNYSFNVEKKTMKNLTNAVAKFIKSEDGPTAVEYAVMLALIIVVCITAVTTLGSNANKTFTSVGTAIGGASS
jgi:pilus assembly protein Flp/PilA